MSWLGLLVIVGLCILWFCLAVAEADERLERLAIEARSRDDIDGLGRRLGVLPQGSEHSGLDDEVEHGDTDAGHDEVDDQGNPDVVHGQSIAGSEQ